MKPVNVGVCRKFSKGPGEVFHLTATFFPLLIIFPLLKFAPSTSGEARISDLG